MKRFTFISGIALVAFLVTALLTLFGSQDPKLRKTSATATQNGLVLEGQILYQRGFLSGVADYSISEGWKRASSDRVLTSIKSGETKHSEIEWTVDWAKLGGRFVTVWILVGLVFWWWNQKEPHQPEKSTESE